MRLVSCYPTGMSPPSRAGLSARRPPRTAPPTIYDLSFAQVVERLGDREHAAEVYRQLYRLRRPAGDVLAAHPQLDIGGASLVERTRVAGRRTTKHLFALDD